MSEPNSDQKHPLALSLAGQLAAATLVLVMFGCATKISLVSPSSPVPWPIEIDFIIVASTGAIAGIVIGNRHPVLGLVCGAVSGLGGLVMTNLYCLNFTGGAMLGVLFSALGTVPGVFAYAMICSHFGTASERASNAPDKIEEDGYRFASERLEQWHAAVEEARQ